MKSSPRGGIAGPVAGIVAWSALLVFFLETRSASRTEQVDARVRALEQLLAVRTAPLAMNEVQPAPPPVHEAELTHHAQPVQEDVSPSPAVTAKTKPRRLTGFYKVGTTGVGMTCYTFSGAVSQVDMSTDHCRFDANNICRGCFVATEDNVDKVLEVAKCSTARFKAGESVEEQIMLEITVVNADSDNLLTVKGCRDGSCTPPLSSHTVSAGVAATGYCYTNGTDRLYFPPEAFQHGDTYDFAGKTITGGTFHTIDIDGGSINNADISLTSSTTLDVSTGTLGLADGQVPANKVSDGTFTPGAYSFAGSTVSHTDIDGGTISNTNIVGSNIDVPLGNTLDVSAGTLNLAGSQVPAESVGPGTFGPGTYSFVGSTISYTGVTLDGVNIGLNQRGLGLFTKVFASEKVITSTGIVSATSPTSNTQCGTIFSKQTPLLVAGMTESITVTNNKAGHWTPIVATAGGCSGGGLPIVLDVTPLAGSFTVRVKNIGMSDCWGPYSVHFLVLGD